MTHTGHSWKQLNSGIRGLVTLWQAEKESGPLLSFGFITH